MTCRNLLLINGNWHFGCPVSSAFQGSSFRLPIYPLWHSGTTDYRRFGIPGFGITALHLAFRCSAFNPIEALNESQSSNSNQWPSLIVYPELDSMVGTLLFLVPVLSVDMNYYTACVCSNKHQVSVWCSSDWPLLTVRIL